MTSYRAYRQSWLSVVNTRRRAIFFFYIIVHSEPIEPLVIVVDVDFMIINQKFRDLTIKLRSARYKLAHEHGYSHVYNDGLYARYTLSIKWYPLNKNTTGSSDNYERVDRNHSFFYPLSAPHSESFPNSSLPWLWIQNKNHATRQASAVDFLNTKSQASAWDLQPFSDEKGCHLTGI